MILSILKIKTDLKKIFIIFSFLACWASISTSFQDLLTINNLETFSFIKLVNFLRHFNMYLIFPILIFLNLNFFMKEKKFKINTTLLFLALYFLFQTPGLIITENYFGNISYIISALNLIMLSNLIYFLFSYNEKKIFILISLIFLLVIFILSVFPNLPGFLNGKNNLYGAYLSNSEIFLNKSTPRSSGMARSALIIIILFEFILFNSSKKLILLKNVIQAVLITFILLLQSRTVLLLLFFYLFGMFFFTYKLTLRNILQYLLINIFIPSLFAIVLLNHSGSNVRVQITDEGNKNSLEVRLSNLKQNLNVQIRGMPNVGFTSGRFNDWNNLRIEIKNHYLLGAGSQADRFLINQTASNGILYAISSSGLIGFASFLIFSILVFFRVSKILFWNKKRNINLDLFCFIILIILARSLLETSYAVFSIDLIILITCLNFIDEKKLMIK